MSTRLVLVAVLAAVLFCAAACASAGSVADRPLTDTLYMPRHAKGFIVEEYRGSTILTVSDPWQGARGVYQSVIRLAENADVPEFFDGVVLKRPLEKVICMSSSYVAFIDALGETSTIKAVSGARFITNEEVVSGHAKGIVADVGYDSNLNYELIASIKPDLMLIYGIWTENNAVTNKLDELSVPYLYIGDYVEDSPLGKSEWLVAFGELFGKREMAENIFNDIEGRYNELRDKASSYFASDDKTKNTVMLNAPYRDTWFVPGDDSYIVHLISDAGGEYACAGVSSEETRPISSENAFIAASRSDIWLNPGQASTMKEVVAMNPRFSDVPSVRSGRVYNATLRSTPDGGSDFWESGAVRADVVLQDLVHIITPELMPDHQLYYFRRME